MATIGTILQILGSLGLFLFGMKVLSEGIQKTAGERMRRIMATMTKNRFSGLITGFLTTSLLQSSSATTVIVVSFVNVGLLTLVESIGVIMGANLGTTITAWIIAWVGKFSIASYAVPIIGIGFPFVFVGKGQWKSLGETIVGFGLLFFGLGLLKKSVPNVKTLLADAMASGDKITVDRVNGIQDTVEWLSEIPYGGSILIFLTIGIILTVIVQSSSAAMAITITLASQGWIGFEESCAIVLGENIGTTITAWLAALGANINAKRAARAHFLFNVIGTLWILLVFGMFTKMVLSMGDMLPDWFRPPTIKAASENIDPFDLALFHTLFNLLNICLLIGFVPLIAKIVTKWVKRGAGDSGDDDRLTYITQGLVDVGELNLPEAEKAVQSMAGLTRDMHAGFIDIFNQPDKDLSSTVKELKKMEDHADEMMHDITDYLIRCSSAQLSGRNAEAVSKMMRIVPELEEISDCIYRLIKLTERKYSKGRVIDGPALDGIQKLSEKVGEFIAFYCDRIGRTVSLSDLETANKIEDSIDALRKSYNKAATSRMQEGGDIKREMLNIDLNNQLEKIGNHALNIIETSHGDLIDDDARL
ncbi:MAG: phosphate:Na+ symporter [Verrucomicrobiales bacterium]|jgi:phosphate:Na+ symporter